MAAIQDDTSGAVAAMSQISGIINNINEIQMTIASAIEEQTATTAEITRSIAGVATGSAEISYIITSVPEAANETSEAAVSDEQHANHMQAIANSLSDVIGSSHLKH